MKKKAQSEMVGFGLIIIVVAVLILIFISTAFKKTNEDIIESFEVEAFVQSLLLYTTDCAINYEPNYYSIRRLLFACSEERVCTSGENSCDVLDETLSELVSESWPVGVDRPEKGYSLNITIKGEPILSYKAGNFTAINKGSSQSFESGLDLIFVVYT